MSKACFRHRLLPLLVFLHPPLESGVPLLCPHYQASSLLRTRPSLRLALVLGSSWVHHLEVSLSIKAQVPTFHTIARAGLSPSSCRSPLGQSAGTLRASSQANNWSLVLTTSLRFRHVSNCSLAFDLPADTLRIYPPFPQRSPPQPLFRSSLQWFEPDPAIRPRPALILGSKLLRGFYIVTSSSRRVVVGIGNDVRSECFMTCISWDSI